MNTAEQILVVILSTTLAVLLVLAIVALAGIIKLVKTLQIIANKAEGFVDSAEAVSNMVRQTVGKLSLAHFVKSVIDLVHKKEK
jgi:hypothetical protein